MLASGLIPPLAVLNDLLRRHASEAGMGAACHWPAIELDAALLATCDLTGFRYAVAHSVSARVAGVSAAGGTSERTGGMRAGPHAPVAPTRLCKHP